MLLMTDGFLYQQFRIGDDQKTVFFDYQISRGTDTYSLTETLKFPVELTEAANPALRALHLALGISYYKTFLSPAISHPYAMEEAEAAFWNDVWRNGLGEFLYVNQLKPDMLARFSPQGGLKGQPIGHEADGSALLGIGGGKDSIVAGELLKDIGLKISGFVMATGEQLGQAKAVAETMGVNLLVVERQLDKKLLELQKLSGAYSGHVPISLIFGLVGTVLAQTTGASYVAVANEASASIPRVNADFGAVNHQWSKSFGFEQKLQNFIKENIDPDVTYFSAIRELSSVAVAKIFGGLPQYFEKFTSDNYVFRIDPTKRPNSRWSLDSPKSLSSFILLAPWTSEAEMLRIFGRNFLDETSLEELFLRLTGLKGEPPLDCVGTTEELVLSLNLAAAQGKFAGSYLMKLAEDRGAITESEPEPAPMLTLRSDQALPAELASKITGTLKSELAK